MNKAYNRFVKEIIKDNSGRTLAIVILTFAKIFAMATIPKTYQYIIDKSLINKDMHTFTYLIIVLACLYFLDVFSGIYKGISVTKICERNTYKLRKKLNDKMLSAKYSEIVTKNLSEITSLYTNEIRIINNHIGNGIFSVFGNIILFVISATIIAVVDKRIFLLTLLTIFIYYLNGKLWANEIKENSEINFNDNKKIIQIINDNYNNLIINKVMNLFKFINSRFEKSYNNYYKSSIRLKSIKIKYRYISTLLVYLMMIVIWAIGGREVIKNNLSIGSLTALISYQTMVLGPIQSVSNFIQSYNTTTIALERLNTFFHLDNDFINLNGENIKEIEKIELNNIGFGFNGELIFDNINIVVEKGDILGIFGESGSGKSTLLKVLSGLYKPTEGNIYINDKDVDSINKTSIYNKIGYLEQESKLFNGTIRENVDLGRSIDNKLIYEVLKKLRLTRNSDYSYMSYNIKDSGDNLSGGQKKRIDIARSLIKKPELILLDESLSSLDKDSKKNVLNYITENREQKIIVIVSHNREDLSICNKYLNIR